MFTKNQLTNSVDSGFPLLVENLSDFVAIPSVSSDPASADDLWQSARQVQGWFEALGFKASVLQAESEDGSLGQPAVVAKSPSVEGAPTVLLYAHHDVQPAGDWDRWQSPPFELAQRGDRLYGRGTSDDGAGIMVHLGALRALGENLPVNVTVFIEGEEEVGSPSFRNFLSKYRDDLEADVIIVADSGNWTTDIPSVTSSLRGVASVDVRIKVLDHAVHSGFFGGPILDAVTLASRLIATLHDEDGNVAVKGLGGQPKAEVDWDEEQFRKDASAVSGYQLAGTGDLAARVWTMPALSVIGLDTTSVAASANAILPECTFRLSLRTVPGVDPAKSAAALVQHLERNTPFGADLEVTPQELGPSYTADLSHETVRDLRWALGEAWGSDAVAIGQGGSIPFIAEFERSFPNAVVLVTGVEDPATNAHSENESQSVKVLRNATLAEALLLARIGGVLSEVSE